MIPKINTTL